MKEREIELLISDAIHRIDTIYFCKTEELSSKIEDLTLFMLKQTHPDLASFYDKYKYKRMKDLTTPEIKLAIERLGEEDLMQLFPAHHIGSVDGICLNTFALRDSTKCVGELYDQILRGRDNG